MNEKLVLGPLLSLENDNKYVVCFLSKTTQNYFVHFNDEKVKAFMLGNLNSGYLYRAECIIPKEEYRQEVSYKVESNNQFIQDKNEREFWKFTIPSKDKDSRFSYNSYENLMDCKLLEKELESPHDLLILNEFTLLDEDVYTKLNRIDDINRKSLDGFFEELYIQKWNDKNISLALASIPNIIMKQEHKLLQNEFHDEINYLEDINHSCKKYFEIFQLRTIKNNTLLTKDRTHYSFALKLGNNQILSVDDSCPKNQSEIISKYLSTKDSTDKLFILCDSNTKTQSL